MNDPLSDFQEGQWWVAELDSAATGAADDFKRAVAVVHHMLRSAAEQEALRKDASLNLVGRWLFGKTRRQAAESGVQQAARNLRKQGAPLWVARAILARKA